MISFECFKKNIKSVIYDNRILKGYIVTTEKGSIGFYPACEGSDKGYIRLHVFSGYVVELNNRSAWHWYGEQKIADFMEFLKNHEKNCGEVLTLKN